MSDQVQQILVPFLGALQASIAVLLTILAGVVAAQFDLIGETSAKEISKLCVKLFLPALLIVNAIKYVPIVIWSSAYSVLSLLFGMSMTRIFDLPEWATPAIAFNNTTSIPLLLVQALDSASILGSIDSGDDAVKRAKSFFLVNSMISNSLTFALGPKFMKGTKRDEEEEGPPSDEQIEVQEQEAEQANEETSLLPNAVPPIRVLLHQRSAGRRRARSYHRPGPTHPPPLLRGPAAWGLPERLAHERNPEPRRSLRGTAGARGRREAVPGDAAHEKGREHRQDPVANVAPDLLRPLHLLAGRCDPADLCLRHEDRPPGPRSLVVVLHDAHADRSARANDHVARRDEQRRRGGRTGDCEVLDGIKVPYHAIYRAIYTNADSFSPALLRHLPRDLFRRGRQPASIRSCAEQLIRHL
nr:hypothetical protein CFP56_00700 [Quercus suber]